LLDNQLFFKIFCNNYFSLSGKCHYFTPVYLYFETLTQNQSLDPSRNSHSGTNIGEDTSLTWKTLKIKL